jgi:hypothetical protein
LEKLVTVLFPLLVCFLFFLSYLMQEKNPPREKYVIGGFRLGFSEIVGGFPKALSGLKLPLRWFLKKVTGRIVRVSK